MKDIKQAKLVTPLDLAKVLGVEKEYLKELFEQQLNVNRKIVMSDDFENEKKEY